jgi:hypothetical protein
MLAKTARRGLSTVVLVTAGLALTACGSGNTSSAPSSSGASPAASAAQAAPAGSSSAAGADGTSAAGTGGSQAGSSASDPESGSNGGSDQSASAGGSGGSGKSLPACATSQLKTSAQSTTSGMGRTGFQLVFQNAGPTTCTLIGYPGVSFVKIHNIQLGKAASRTGAGTSAVTLIPNAHAYADLQTTNGQGGYSAAQCDLTTVPTLRVYPPNQTESTNIPWNTQECVGSAVQNLQVGPVHGTK